MVFRFLWKLAFAHSWIEKEIGRPFESPNFLDNINRLFNVSIKERFKAYRDDGFGSVDSVGTGGTTSTVPANGFLVSFFFGFLGAAFFAGVFFVFFFDTVFFEVDFFEDTFLFFFGEAFFVADFFTALDFAIVLFLLLIVNYFSQIELHSCADKCKLNLISKTVRQKS
jgi:hypothetical protein